MLNWFPARSPALCLGADDARTAVVPSPAHPTVREALELSRCEGSVNGWFDLGWQARFPPKLVGSVYQLQFTSCLPLSRLQSAA